MDRRETNHKWYEEFDEGAMTVTVRDYSQENEEDFVKLRVEFEVCGTCDGKGKHVNPAIDSNGLTAEDFDRDPDFRENYFSGMYDVPCHECHGRRVVPTLPDNAPEAHKRIFERKMDELAEENMERYYQQKYQY